jgi:hypothetical protein
MKNIFTPILLLLLTFNLSAQPNIKNESDHMNDKKQFSLLVRVPISYTTEQAQAVGPQWDELLKDWKVKNLYFLSFAFPGASNVVGADGTVSSKPVISDNLRVVSNIVLQCTNLDEALAQAQRCPILAHGGSVEVREIPRGVTYADR